MDVSRAEDFSERNFLELKFLRMMVSLIVFKGYFHQKFPAIQYNYG